MSLRVSLLVLLVVLPIASRVSAQPVQEVEMPPSEVAARGHYLMGLEAYRGGRFDDAAREFGQAYELSHHTELLFNLFLAQRDAVHTAAAVDSLRAYIAATPDADNAELMRARLATMETQLAAEQEREREHAAIVATETAASEAEASEAEEMPDEHAVAPPAPAPGPDAAPWIVVGVGGALVIGAIVTGALTASTYADVSNHCPDGVCPTSYDLEQSRSSGTTLALTTDILGAVGAAAIAVGLVWGIVDLTSSHEPAPTDASIACSPLGCRGTF
jgi:hypothetical protein